MSLPYLPEVCRRIASLIAQIDRAGAGQHQVVPKNGQIVGEDGKPGGGERGQRRALATSSLTEHEPGSTVDHESSRMKWNPALPLGENRSCRCEIRVDEQLGLELIVTDEANRCRLAPNHDAPSTRQNDLGRFLTDSRSVRGLADLLGHIDRRPTVGSSVQPCVCIRQAVENEAVGTHSGRGHRATLDLTTTNLRCEMIGA